MTTPGSTLLDINVGELTLIGSRRQTDATHMAVLPASRRAHADRRRETLFVFLDLGGGGASGLARTMLERLNQTYWQKPGAVTSALRHAMAAANAHLLEENRLLSISQRRRGGLLCIVLRDNRFYLAQIGPARALLAQDGQVTQFPQDPRGETPLGISRGLDIHFSHSSLNAGDVLLLTGKGWSAGLPEGALLATLGEQEGSAQDIMRALERQAGVAPVSALIVECALPGSSPAPKPSAASVRHSTGEWVQAPPDALAHHSPSTAEAQSDEPLAIPRHRDRDASAEAQPREGGRLSNLRDSLPIDAERLDQARQSLRQAGETLGQGARTLLTRVLPEPEPAPRRRRARDAVAENTPMMIGIAVAIPLLVAFMVATFYLQRNATARHEALLNKADEAIQAARQADGQDARERWDAALQAAQQALFTAPSDNKLAAWRDEAQATLDALDGVLRPELIALGDYGPGQGRRLAATRLQVYVLDTEQDQVTQHMQNEGDQYTLVAYRGFSVGEAQVGELRDVMWLEAGGAWVNDALLILTDDHQLLQ
ncbi:MAG: hypothetical protein GY831_23215, partial [Delftia sp.]|nr:hypothetical protein [Delftia sp.]